LRAKLRTGKAAVHAVQPSRATGSRPTAQPTILFGLLRFRPGYRQEYPDGTVIIRNADGFDLALHPAEHIQPPPVFLHSGFRAAQPQDVRALMQRMEADGITIVERDDEPAYTAFKCLDSDGHRIEVYWEPPFSR
jgi:catechol 2,3-dioxygenase-like lactoylglutathione lyase family enzyme